MIETYYKLKKQLPHLELFTVGNTISIYYNQKKVFESSGAQCDIAAKAYLIGIAHGINLSEDVKNEVPT